MFKRISVSMHSVQLRSAFTQFISLGLVVSTAFMLWKSLVVVTGTNSPVVVVLTGSMEPGFRRGDILFLNMNQSPIESGEIVVFKIEGKEIPIVHRVTRVHRNRDTNDFIMLTKGDNNDVDDSYGVYADGQEWIEQHHVIGRVIGYLPYVGYVTIVMTEKPIIKYLLISGLSLFALITNSL